MAYSLPTQSVDLFLSELNKIRRGAHANFRGDKVENGEQALLRFCREHPERAIDFACDMRCGVTSDFHPDRVKGFAKTIVNYIESNKLL